MPSGRRKKSKHRQDDEIDLLSSEFLASTSSRRANSKSKKASNENMGNNRLENERALTQSILEDLESQSSSLGMDFAPPRAWRPNPLYEEGEEVVLDDFEERQKVNDTSGNDNGNSDDGQQPSSPPTRACPSSTAKCVKKYYLDCLAVTLTLTAVAVLTFRFGFPDAFNELRFASAERESGQDTSRTGGAPAPVPGLDPGPSPTYSPSAPLPTYAPSLPWPTYSPTITWPTYNPTVMPSPTPTLTSTTPVAIAINGTNSTNENNETLILTNQTIIDDDIFVEGNSTEDDLFVEDANTTTSNSTIGNATSINDEVDTAGDNTTSSTVLPVTNSTVDSVIVDESTSVEASTTSTEASMQSSTSTTSATTTANEENLTTTVATTTALTTTSSENDVTSTTTSTIAAAPATISPYICSETTSGKIFKLIITPTTSTSSLALFRQDENDGEYIMVNTYNDDPQLTIGESYTNKLCVTPGKYKFVAQEVEDACYDGFFKGVQIFGECGDGEYGFEF